MTDSQKKRIILITGTSSGFGMLTALRLAKNHTVIASMRNVSKETQLLKEAQLLNVNDNIKIVQLDVTDLQSIDHAFQTIGNDYGYLDILVNNAGYGIGGAFEDLTQEEIRQQMETNFFGVQNVIRKAIPFMRQRHDGKIINVSSMAGLSASPFLSAYNSSKWALEAFSESLRYELKPFNIDVLMVEPGLYRTKIFQENAKYAAAFDNPQSPYFNLSQHLKKATMNAVKSCTKDPYEVALLIERLIERKRNAFRNIPDTNARIQYILRKFLPFAVYSWIVYTAMNFGRKGKFVK